MSNRVLSLYSLATEGDRLILDCPLTEDLLKPTEFVKLLLSMKLEPSEKSEIPDYIDDEVKEVIKSRKYIPQVILELFDYCCKIDDPLWDVVAAVCAIYTVAYDDVEESTFSREAALMAIKLTKSQSN